MPHLVPGESGRFVAVGEAAGDEPATRVERARAAEGEGHYVGIRREAEGLGAADLAGVVELDEMLVEELHAVVAVGDCLREARDPPLEDCLAHHGGVPHDLDDRDPRGPI